MERFIDLEVNDSLRESLKEFLPIVWLKLISSKKILRVAVEEDTLVENSSIGYNATVRAFVETFSRMVSKKNAKKLKSELYGKFDQTIPIPFNDCKETVAAFE